jgi:serine/threonine protein kinase
LDNYNILRTLGVGASCKVKLGEHQETGQKVAIKIMSTEVDEKTMELVLAEVEALQKLSHENIL